MSVLGEPVFTTLLRDPLVRLMMVADGVDPSVLSASLTEVAGQLRRQSLGPGAIGAPGPGPDAASSTGEGQGDPVAWPQAMRAAGARIGDDHRDAFAGHGGLQGACA